VPVGEYLVFNYTVSQDGASPSEGGFDSARCTGKPQKVTLLTLFSIGAYTPGKAKAIVNLTGVCDPTTPEGCNLRDRRTATIRLVA
jgi:hypothetical protein